ncbi:hypothetical protein ACO1O0_002632 [Amphichorda felina]
MDPRAREQAETLLLGVGRTYGIKAGRDQVRQALDHPEHGPAFADWANLHLSPDNLLTADEIALYTALDKSGEVDRLAALHDLAEIPAVTEDEIRGAIEELKRSTDAISKQTETLRQQQDALSRLVKKTAESDTRRQEFEHARQRRSESERKRIAAEVEDLSHSLGFRISDIDQQADESGTVLNQTVDGILSSDDKLLSSLQKLGWELDQQDPEEAQTVERLREVCMRLIKNTVETLRTKLDRVYLESLTEAERSGMSKPASSDEVNALQEEVESLYSEILPVAQMSVEQQHLGPALESVSSRNGQSLGRSVAAVTYIIDCLNYLLDRTQRLRDRVEALRSHQSASASILATAKAELSAPAEPDKTPAMPPVPASPVRPRANTANTGARRRSSGLFEEPPLDALLQSLAIYLDDDAEGADKVKMLATTLDERSNKAADVAQGGQESFEATAATHVDDVRRALQLLKDSLLAESPFGEVKLVDPEIEGSIGFLSTEVSQIRDTLERVEAKRGNGKSEKKEEILRRWG